MIYTNKYGTQLNLLNKDEVKDLYKESCFYVTAFYDGNEYIIAYGFKDEPTAIDYARSITHLFLLRTRVFRFVVDPLSDLSNCECFRYDSGRIYYDHLYYDAMIAKKDPYELETNIIIHNDVDISNEDLFSL